MEQYLSSWNDTATKSAITEFLRSVTEPGDAFVPPAERLAAFDNDGTLWCEKPSYPQADSSCGGGPTSSRPIPGRRTSSRGRPSPPATARGWPLPSTTCLS